MTDEARLWKLTIDEPMPYVVWVKARWPGNILGEPAIRMRDDVYWSVSFNDMHRPEVKYWGNEPPMEWTL